MGCLSRRALGVKAGSKKEGNITEQRGQLNYHVVAATSDPEWIYRAGMALCHCPHSVEGTVSSYST